MRGGFIVGIYWGLLWENEAMDLVLLETWLSSGRFWIVAGCK